MRASLAPAVALLSIGLLSGCATGGAGAAAARSSASGAGTIESADRRLSAALLAEAAWPSAHSHLQVAREYARLGVLDAAQKRTEQALRRDPHLADAHEMLARIWRDWGMPGTALVHAHRALFYDPRSSAGYNTLGTVLEALGNVDDARAAFLKAFDLDAGAGWALSNLCYLEFRQGNLAEAQRQCEAALRASPGLPTAHNNLGLAHAASGDLAGARQSFLAAGDAATADYNIGIVHLAAGRYTEAAQAFERAVAARPAFTAAKTRAHEARMRELGARDRKQP